MHVGDICFTQLKEMTRQSRDVRFYGNSLKLKSFYSHGTAFDGLDPCDQGSITNPNGDGNMSLEQYKEYMWLFGSH